MPTVLIPVDTDLIINMLKITTLTNIVSTVKKYAAISLLGFSVLPVIAELKKDATA